MLVGLTVAYLSLVSDISQSRKVLTDCRKNPKYEVLWKLAPLEAPCPMRTVGQQRL
jgi:hypothetical protein